MSHVLNVAYSRDVEMLEQTTSDDPVRSLTEDAQRAGTKPAQLAKACGLDLGLLSKLNSRQIQPWTIPAELIGMLVEQLNKSVAALMIFFAGSPRAAAGKAYLSRGKPTGTAQQSFAEAVRQSSLSDEEKARWLNDGTVEEVGRMEGFDTVRALARRRHDEGLRRGGRQEFRGGPAGRCDCDHGHRAQRRCG